MSYKGLSRDTPSVSSVKAERGSDLCSYLTAGFRSPGNPSLGDREVCSAGESISLSESGLEEQTRQVKIPE